MPDVSARLGLPHILPSQAQKHVTHNEAITALDALVHLKVEGRDLDMPPSSPLEGETWITGSAPTGDWAGQPGRIAFWSGSGWHFYDLKAGMRAWDTEAGAFVLFDGSEWQSVGGSPATLDGIGINTDWDTTNRLSIAAEASLFSHDGASHQLKINKAVGSDTASLLFQSDWTGHAEMGLVGDTDFSIKVSADGSSWTPAMRFDGVTGHATGAAVQTDASDLTAGKLALVGATYGPRNLVGPVSQTGGTPTGAVLERGENADGSFVRLADGTQICWSDSFSVSATSEAALSAVWTYPASFVASPSVGFSLTLIDTNWTGLSRSQVSSWGPITAPTATNVELAIYPTVGTGAVTATVAGTCPVAVGRWF